MAGLISSNPLANAAYDQQQRYIEQEMKRLAMMQQANYYPHPGTIGSYVSAPEVAPQTPQPNPVLLLL